MGINLIPKELKFFDFFIMEAENIAKAAEYFKCSLKKGTIADDVVKKMKDFEHEGDTLCHEIVDSLNKTFITPIDREDIFDLANTMDDLLDLINAVATRMKLYKLDSSDEYLEQFVDAIEQSTHALSNAIKHMHDTKRMRRVQEYCIEINRLENIGDQIREKAIGHLFEYEKDPIMVIKWKEVYEVAEGTLDVAEHVAKVIEGILVKHG
ncbi:MAG: DUF47 domain-containing protein [Elusimicrobia bacterium]|nr:DUF47 domain-containing protein [Elusimicrobiota bacterium]